MLHQGGRIVGYKYLIHIFNVVESLILLMQYRASPWCFRPTRSIDVWYMAQTSNTGILKGVGRELFLLLFGAGIGYACLRLALLGDTEADIMYLSPGFWIFMLAPYLGLQLVRSIKWAGDNLKDPGE